MKENSPKENSQTELLFIAKFTARKKINFENIYNKIFLKVFIKMTNYELPHVVGYPFSYS